MLASCIDAQDSAALFWVTLVMVHRGLLSREARRKQWDLSLTLQKPIMHQERSRALGSFNNEKSTKQCTNAHTQACINP